LAIAFPLGILILFLALDNLFDFPFFELFFLASQGAVFVFILMFDFHSFQFLCKGSLPRFTSKLFLTNGLILVTCGPYVPL
jgi:hypothetical protein